MAAAKPTTYDPQPQDQWIKHGQFHFFKTVERAECILTTVVLSHHIPIEVLHSHWEQISRDIYTITIAARRMLADEVETRIFQEREILKAEQDVLEAMESAHAYFDALLRQAERQRANAGLSKLPVRGGTTKLYEALGTTPMAAQWLELLRKADTYLNWNHQLWLIGEISPSAQTEQEALTAMLNNQDDVRDTLMCLSRSIHKQYSTIRELMRIDCVRM